MKQRVTIWHELHFPRDLTHEAVLQWVRTLAMRPRLGLLGQSRPIVLEAHCQGGRLRWFMGLDGRDSPSVTEQLRIHLPSIRFEKVESRPELNVSRAAELRLNTARRPLRFDEAEGTAAALLTALKHIGKDETLVLQWLVGPWLPRPVIKRRGEMKQGVGVERLVLQLAMDSEDVMAYRKKLSEPLLGCVGRLGVSAASRNRERLLVQRVLGALHLTREPGVGLVTRFISGRSVARRMDRLSRPLIAWPCPLNAAELAAVMGWPLGSPAILGVVYSGRRLLPAPAGLVVRETTATRHPERYRVLARTTHPGSEGLLHLSADDALQHLHVIGPTGAGKSTLLARLIEQDMVAGRSVVVIEPKQDLINDVLDRVPEHRIDDVVLLDPTDIEQVVGLNVLACQPHEAELVVDQLIHVLRELYRDSWGPRTQDVLHGGLLTLARVGGFSICDLPVLFTNPALRRSVLERLGSDSTLAGFWAGFNAMSEAERREVIAPALNKLRAFTYRQAIRHTLGQADTAFRMKPVFTERKVLLVNLAKGLVGPEAARLLGALVFSNLWQTALGRSAVVPQKRQPVMIYIDEFQDYVSGVASDFGEILAQARGLGVGLTLAHQHLGQLSPPLKAAVLSNARSRVAFQSGHQDASALASALGGDLNADDLMSLERFECYASLVRDGRPTLPCSAQTLSLSAAHGNGERVRESSRQRYGRPVEEVEAAMRSRLQLQAPAKAYGGRKRRPA